MWELYLSPHDKGAKPPSTTFVGVVELPVKVMIFDDRQHDAVDDHCDDHDNNK